MKDNHDANRPRTQLVSSVDNVYSVSHPTVKQWVVDSPQLTTREAMMSFISSNFYTENFHVACLRTGKGTSGLDARKLVYYYDWSSSQYQFNTSAAPTGPSGQIIEEYYDVTSDPGETTNNYTSITSGADVTFRNAIANEMQAALPTVNGVALSSLLSTAGADWLAYILPATSVSASPSTFAHSATVPRTITVSGMNIQPGPTINLSGPTSQTFYVPDTATTVTFSYLFTTSGTYTFTIKNPGGSTSSPVTLTVT